MYFVNSPCFPMQVANSEISSADSTLDVTSNTSGFIKLVPLNDNVSFLDMVFFFLPGFNLVIFSLPLLL